MTLFTNTSAAVILGVICLLHLISFILSGIYSKIAGFVNIGLHICLMLPLLLGNTEIKDAALAYMISTFVYVLLAFIFYRAKGKRDDV